MDCEVSTDKARLMVVKAVLFDLGDTLIEERVDNAERLDQMQLHAKPHARRVLEELSGRFSLALVTDTEMNRPGFHRDSRY